MTRRIGTIGHYSSSSGLVMAAALMLAAQNPRKAPPPATKQIKEREVRTERQQWNDEVERRKAEKKANRKQEGSSE